MNEQATLDILNELLASEQGSVVVRLCESVPFISRLSVTDSALLAQMADTTHNNAIDLTSAIHARGCTPGPRIFDVDTGDLHFLELGSALPRLMLDWETLDGKYAIALERLANDSTLVAMLGSILNRRKSELVELQASIQQRSGIA